MVYLKEDNTIFLPFELQDCGGNLHFERKKSIGNLRKRSPYW